MKTFRHITLILLGLLAVLALLAPWISPYSHDSIDWQHLASPPDVASYQPVTSGSSAWPSRPSATMA